MNADQLNVIMAVFVVIFAVEIAAALWVGWLSPRTRKIKREWRAACAEHDQVFGKLAPDD